MCVLRPGRCLVDWTGQLGNWPSSSETPRRAESGICAQPDGNKQKHARNRHRHRWEPARGGATTYISPAPSIDNFCHVTVFFYFILTIELALGKLITSDFIESVSNRNRYSHNWNIKNKKIHKNSRNHFKKLKLIHQIASLYNYNPSKCNYLKTRTFKVNCNKPDLAQPEDFLLKNEPTFKKSQKIENYF